jgi:hypothetical protein
MFVRNKRELVVDCYPPARVRLLWLTLLALVAALVWMWWGYTPAQVAGQRLAGEQERLQLQERLAMLAKERAQLQADVTRLQTMKGVDDGAYDLLRENYEALQGRYQDLQQQLAFYQAVVGTDKGKGKDKALLKIQRFQVESADDGGFDYSLVVLRSDKGKGTLRGSLSLSVRGQGANGKRTLPMKTVTDPAMTSHKLGFRNFQKLAGRLRFPTGFTPQKVILTLDLSSPKIKLVRTYSWDKL